MNREIRFEFVFQHQDSKEIKTKRFTLDEIANGFEDDLFILECDCEPVGETNVVECNCEDYLEDFRLIDKRQYTGLKDRDGKEIYEGDIVRHSLWHERFELRQVIYDQEKCAFDPMGEWSSTVPSLPSHFEIIGNIYENPELLEEG